MVYKIKGDDLVIYDEDIIGNKKNKVLSIALDKIGVLGFSKSEMVEVKILLASKNKIDALSALTGA